MITPKESTDPLTHPQELNPSSSGHRLVAIVVVVGAAATVVMPTLVAENQRVSGPVDPPWALPSVAIVALKPAGSRTCFSRTKPMALIYVDRACKYCEGEIERWEAIAVGLAKASRQSLNVDLCIVASPLTVMGDSTWIPFRFRSNVLHDLDGTIGQALGVQAVPTTVWVDSTGIARIVRVGQTRGSELLANIATMNVMHMNTGESAFESIQDPTTGDTE